MKSMPVLAKMIDRLGPSEDDAIERLAAQKFESLLPGCSRLSIQKASHGKWSIGCDEDAGLGRLSRDAAKL